MYLTQEMFNALSEQARELNREVERKVKDPMYVSELRERLMRITKKAISRGAMFGSIPKAHLSKEDFLAGKHLRLINYSQSRCAHVCYGVEVHSL